MVPAGATLGTETITDLDYADDVALLSEKLEVLLLVLDVLRDEAHLPVWKLTGRRLRSNLPLIWLLYPHQFWSQVTQLTSLSPLSTSAQKSTPPVVQNLKSAAGSVWPKPASINLIEEYGAPACLSLPKFNYTEYSFNRSSSTALKHGP